MTSSKPLLALLLCSSGFAFVVLLVLVFFLGVCLGLVSLDFFSFVVDFLEEAIVLQGERGFEFLTLWIMVFGFEAVNGV